MSADALCYLPTDKTGIDLLLQVISQRCETGSAIVTTHQAQLHWAKAINNDATLTPGSSTLHERHSPGGSGRLRLRFPAFG